MAQEFMNMPETKHFFEEADDALSQHLTKLMLDGDEKELGLTENTQPALLLSSYVAYKYLEKQTGEKLENLCKYVAGHSLGEYSALCVADVFSLSDGLRLVKKRGQAMQQAVPVGVGGMAAIISSFTTEELQQNLVGKCWIANDNANGQVVISGKMEDVDASCEKLTNAGAKRVIKLPVSAPFHSELMQPAADVMAEELEKVSFNKPAVGLIQNVTAEVINDTDIIKSGLVQQMCGQVKWRESMQLAAQNDVTQLYELGSGKVLTGLAKRCDKTLKAMQLNTPQQIDTLLEELHKERVA
jgi:[acyl-carrier-protein] S-malonyltransferase